MLLELFMERGTVIDEIFDDPIGAAATGATVGGLAGAGTGLVHGFAQAISDPNSSVAPALHLIHGVIGGVAGATAGAAVPLAVAGTAATGMGLYYGGAHLLSAAQQGLKNIKKKSTNKKQARENAKPRPATPPYKSAIDKGLITAPKITKPQDPMDAVDAADTARFNAVVAAQPGKSYR